MERMTWQLGDPQLGLLERLGVGGMALALSAYEDFGADYGEESPALQALEWHRTENSLTLEWPEKYGASDVLIDLYAWAFQPNSPVESDEFGVIYIPAVHGTETLTDETARLVEHRGICSTFLQHNRTQPKTDSRQVEYHLEGDRLRINLVELQDKFAFAKNFRDLFYTSLDQFPGIGESTADRIIEHLGGGGGAKGARIEQLTEVRGISESKARMISSQFKGLKQEVVSFSSFLFPGATARHSGEKSWTGTAKQAVALFFAPTVCFYVRLDWTEWAVVAPDVRNLEAFLSYRYGESPREDRSWAASPPDAGLGVLSRARKALEKETADAMEIFGHGIEGQQDADLRCEVFQLGDVAWNRQTVRSNFARIRPTKVALEAYRILASHLGNRLRLKNDGESSFVDVPSPRGPIAENLLDGRPWYRDLFSVPRYLRDSVEKQSAKGESLQKAWFRLMNYHHEPLRRVMSEMNELDPNERDEHFVSAFHDALRNHYGIQARQAERGSRSATQRMEDFVDQTRRDLMKANTRKLLRKTLTEFFAEARTNETLKEYGDEIWQFIDDDREWERARDLALLSLVTYTGKGKEKIEETVQEATEEAAV